MPTDRSSTRPTGRTSKAWVWTITMARHPRQRVLVVTPVTALAAMQPTGPAARVSFIPAFWLLVPGALGLVGVADLLGGDPGGPNPRAATIGTMVAIALGVLAGSVVSNRMQRPAL